MPYTVTIENWHEFVARHCGQQLNCDGLLIFADGASASADDSNLRSEPPRDPVELLRMKLRYWRQAVKTSERDFVNTRAFCAASLALRAIQEPARSWTGRR